MFQCTTLLSKAMVLAHRKRVSYITRICSAPKCYVHLDLVHQMFHALIFEGARYYITLIFSVLILTLHVHLFFLISGHSGLSSVIR